MQNRNTPATAIRIDNGADEPVNHPGLSKLEYTAIHILAGMEKHDPRLALAEAKRLWNVMESREEQDDDRRDPDND
jgi:hypothetical protein